MTPKFRPKNRRKIPLKNTHNNQYPVSRSQSQSPSSSTEPQFDPLPITNKSDDASYIDSDSNSMSQTPSDQFSSQPSKSNPASASNSLNSYINIAPLPIFHGDPNECPITHLSRFIKVCRANNASAIDAMVRIFPVTLEDEAALWYDLNIEPYNSLNWEEIKSSFLDAYHKIELIDQLREELAMINQGENESVRSYFLRLQWILKKWPENGLSDGLLKGIFVDGLRQDFQDWMIPQKPNSLNEALRLAFSFEQVQGIRGGFERLKCGFCEGMHEEKRCEIREKMREMWRKSNGVMAEFERPVSVSVSGSDVGKINGGEDERLLGWKKKSQCQCSKHQCGNKKLERNSSVLTQNSNDC